MVSHAGPGRIYTIPTGGAVRPRPQHPRLTERRREPGRGGDRTDRSIANVNRNVDPSAYYRRHICIPFVTKCAREATAVSARRPTTGHAPNTRRTGERHGGRHCTRDRSLFSQTVFFGCVFGPRRAVGPVRVVEELFPLDVAATLRLGSRLVEELRSYK